MLLKKKMSPFSDKLFFRAFPSSIGAVRLKFNETPFENFKRRFIPQIPLQNRRIFPNFQSDDRRKRRNMVVGAFSFEKLKLNHITIVLLAPFSILFLSAVR